MIFKKNRCTNCGKKVKGNYNFCPHCGFPLKINEKDWGLLGKKEIKEQTPLKPELFSGFGSGILNKMIGNAMKLIEKEMQKNPQTNPPPNSKVKIMINGKEINSIQQNPERKNTKFLPIQFSKENLDKWLKLKKKEPVSNLKRLDNKIKYELEIPGVKSIKDISIVKLENSLEVKAIGKDSAYTKIIPINLPLRKYTLLKGKLTLELDASL